MTLSRPHHPDPADLADFDDDLPAEGGGGGASHTVIVPPDAGGERLDRALAGLLEGTGLSRSRLKSLIEQGRVMSGGATIDDASQRVKPGQTFTIQEPEPEDASPRPQDIPLSILFEDDDLLVIDKDADMVVHPAAGNPDGTLVNALLHHCDGRLSGIGGVRRPGIVHRLDKGTSGLMVVAKTDRAHQGLSAQFADRTLSRTYQAVVWGVPSPREGVVEGAIGRHPVDRKRMAVVDRGGKPATTRYRLVRAFGLHVALVECKLLTGRTHQIRVHMAHLGHPLLGDALYGRVRPARIKAVPEPVRSAVLAFPRQALHAGALEFVHPVSGETKRFTSTLPMDIECLIRSLESL